ncbi:hypothetical protein ACOSP7_005984 [Xanthoceras sorbifolium]
MRRRHDGRERRAAAAAARRWDLTSILTVQQLSSPIKGIDTLMTSNDRIGYQTSSSQITVSFPLEVTKSGWGFEEVEVGHVYSG